MAGYTPLLSQTQLLILPCCLYGGKKDIFELKTAVFQSVLQKGLFFYCLLSSVDTQIVLGAVTIALGMDFAVEFRLIMRSKICST